MAHAHGISIIVIVASPFLSVPLSCLANQRENEHGTPENPKADTQDTGPVIIGSCLHIGHTSETGLNLPTWVAVRGGISSIKGIPCLLSQSSLPSFCEKEELWYFYLALLMTWSLQEGISEALHFSKMLLTNVFFPLSTLICFSIFLQWRTSLHYFHIWWWVQFTPKWRNL